MFYKMQTTIDQFYKVTSNKKRAKVKSIKESSNHRSPIGKKERQFSSKFKSAHEKAKQNPYEVNRRKRQWNNSSSSQVHYLSQTDMQTSLTKIMAPKPFGSPTITFTSPINSQKGTPVSKSSSKFSPKTSSPISIRNESHRTAKIVRRKLFEDRTEELISETINNLNYAKEGAISNNDIDLEEIYSSKKFNYMYNPIDTTTTTKFEIDDVIVPTDTYSLHFFLAIVTVFSNPINCGYFNEDELNFIFSLLTLSKHAQALLIRMFKRQHTWHRISNIKYDEISTDLKPIFDELVSRSIFKNNTEEEDISVLLNLLQVDEIRKICREIKVMCGKKKEDYVQSILKFCNKTKSLFPGMSNPATKLRTSVNKRLGTCVLFNARAKDIFDRIITLLIPNRDPTHTLAEVFRTMLRVEKNEIKFPKVEISDFPIFASKGHLLDYIDAKNTLSDILSAIEKKQWVIVRNLGSLAAQRLPLFLEMETESLQDSTLPHHIRCFMPGYMWLKVLFKSIEAFKKTKETLPQAIEFLRMLINQNCHMQNRKGSWFSELIKIEVYHMKNLDSSVALLSDAVSHKSLTEVDRLDLLERAEMLVKRKTAISKNTKATVQHILDNVLNKARPTSQTSSITIKGVLCRNIQQRKSCWCISNSEDEQMYGSVENFALYHYKDKGYSKGVHCEGAFPILLFGTLFWDEIYNINIPGACVSTYQNAPLDLYSSEFYENRKEQIDIKLQILRKYDSETLSKHLKHAFELHHEYTCLYQGTIFDNSDSFQEVAFCLGVEGILGICERLIHNFRLWKAGFPDLIVWNKYTKQYKIVEVKGPGDSLSIKQKLWLDYLNHLGLNTEVCYCESSKGRKREHEETMT
ncbi:fanconi-associated nuclease 1-like isoform X2 [Nylanderia fulva]|uniref:fanconi-associated nuclease 1-like isoform X2 n=1 Tax=Nylanderia fulva TaxID=613905 RepID=UPI0010FB6A5A|nr:fanconi-associated nuclease 1-like isoform X2 [Nylanderia fulva]